MNACAATADLRQYDAKQCRADDRDVLAAGYLADIVAEHTAPGQRYDPLDADNLAEALVEAPQIVFMRLATCIEQGNAAELLKLMKAHTTDYWRDYAAVVFQGQADDAARVTLE